MSDEPPIYARMMLAQYQAKRAMYWAYINGQELDDIAAEHQCEISTVQRAILGAAYGRPQER